MTGVMTGLVQYALQPQAVELRELPVPELVGLRQIDRLHVAAEAVHCRLGHLGDVDRRGLL